MDKADRYMPKARRNQLVVKELADETLIYDETNQKAYCLNETAALVWRNCDGQNSVARLAQTLGTEIDGDVSEQLVWLALNQLKRSGLLENCLPIPEPIMSRREVTRALGIAAVVAVPLVTSMIVPMAAAAASCASDFDDCTSITCCPGLICCGGQICRPSNLCVG